jgi:hypothetical protein
MEFSRGWLAEGVAMRTTWIGRGAAAAAVLLLPDFLIAGIPA